jgi:DNA polymerase-3 subunit beta
MKFSATVDVKTMLVAVRRGASLIRRGNLPILEFLRLSATSNRITVSGTNLDCWLDSAFDAETASGDVLVSGKELERALGLMPNGAAASLALEGSKLRITSGRVRFDLPTMDPADWPKFQDPEKPSTLRAQAKELMASLERLRPAICTESSRPYLMGVYLDFAQDRMVATNGHILGWEPGCWTLEDGGDAKPLILPVDTLNPLKKMLEDADECEVLVDHDGRKITFRYDGQSFTTKVIDGTYPPYERIIPQAFPIAFRLGREDTALALRRAGSISDGISIPVSLAFADSELTVTCKGKDGEESEDACGATSIKGKTAITLGMASRNIIWAIDSLPGSEEVEIFIVEPTTAVCVMGKGDGDRRHLRVSMPMRI